ncbi:sigma-70 family RNA polymerase sigma factor [Micromonospora sp. NPDC002389]|uniref:sigma-70 family RNA polymerase sigma factor n=1 Tax=Micromonospora sp. NPDC002389 TaxID=3154272 RepID=UPI003333AF7B
MTITADHAALVVAAQAGDRSARDRLVSAHLPLLYNLVGRALSGHPDVDDVVQETLLRVVRDLPTLRAPESFRSWLVAIALRQIASHRHRVRAAVDRVTVVDGVDRMPGGGDVESEAILRLHVSDQRRQVVEATRWLDPAYRPMLALWWQECAGRLTRGEVAAATGTTVAHVGVRLHRMREQLDLGRTIVAALSARPRCPDLAATVGGWDGHPTPVWRKRIARHVRDCPYCAAGAVDRVPAERLLLGIASLAVPAGLTAALVAKGLLAGAAGGTPVLAAHAGAAAVGGTTVAGGAAIGGATAVSGGAAVGGTAGQGGSLLGMLTQAVVAHPVASAAAAAVLIAGTTAGVALRPDPAPAPPPAVAAPVTSSAAPPRPSPTPAATTPAASPSASPTAVRPPVPTGTIPPGTWSLESVRAPGRYLTVDGDVAGLAEVTGASSAQARRRATFTVGRGLADPGCVTLRSADGRYLRHASLRLRLSPDEGTRLFREDATFCPERGATAASVTMRSHNYPHLVVHGRDVGFWIDFPDGTQAFARASSFRVRTPWA